MGTVGSWRKLDKCDYVVGKDFVKMTFYWLLGFKLNKIYFLKFLSSIYSKLL